MISLQLDGRRYMKGKQAQQGHRSLGQKRPLRFGLMGCSNITSNGAGRHNQ